MINIAENLNSFLIILNMIAKEIITNIVKYTGSFIISVNRLFNVSLQFYVVGNIITLIYIIHKY